MMMLKGVHGGTSEGEGSTHSRYWWYEALALPTRTSGTSGQGQSGEVKVESGERKEWLYSGSESHNHGTSVGGGTTSGRGLSTPGTHMLPVPSLCSQGEEG